MKKSILEIYGLAICFITVICFAINLGTGSYDIIRIQKPEFTLGAIDYAKLQTNENFCAKDTLGFSTIKVNCSNRSEGDITKMRQTAYDTALQNEARNGLQALVTALIAILITLLIFIPHWNIARKARTSN